jgi:aspartate aminotransferase, cytoplasmic
MFSYTGLSPFEVKTLRERFHIYLLNSGRISISGCKFLFTVLGLGFSNGLTVNKRNVQYVAKAIHDVRTQGHGLNGTNGTNGTNGVNGH